ncbi:MAG: type VI secretion system baseplate subunit TssG [Pantoea dispersa]
MALVDKQKLVRCDGLWPLLTLGHSQLDRLRPLLDGQSEERPERQQAAELAQSYGGEVEFVGRPVGAAIKEGELNPALQNALDKFTLDVTAKAREGKIDPVFGRDTEIRQMVDILSRRRKNNPILVGEPGVGKTALVEGLALRIAEGNVPESLKPVILRTLDLGLLQAGAGVKGEFEQRLKNVIDAVQQSPVPILLFIDEAHTIIGAGNQAGGADDITQRREGHEALQGFLDIFSHRILTQFYRIWRKYSYPATFEPGGTDTISQSLLGLVGLGIPGTAEHIATPVSRFLALLGVLQQPGKTQEGMQALVSLLAPDTTVQVSPYCLRPVAVSQPLGFYGDDDFLLDGNTPLGEEAMDANSQLLIALFTDNEQESQGWKPDGLLYQDFLVMLRVYLGWRFKAKITLTTRTRLLVAPPLGEGPFWLGMNGVLGAQDEYLPEDFPQTFTTELGYYAGLEPASSQQGNRRVTYKFD